LLLIAVLWLLLIPIYAWPIWQTKRPPTAGSVYRIWPKDRVEVQEQKPTLDNPARIERLYARGYLAAIGWFAYFSLLSAFQIGYRFVAEPSTAAQFYAGVDWPGGRCPLSSLY
jgi:hypothetical protein